MINPDELKCGNCQHWGDPNEGEFRECQGINFDKYQWSNEEEFQEIKEYTLDSPTQKEIETFEKATEFRENNLAIIQDGSGYRACLKTKEDFACSLFLPIPKEPIS